MQGVSEMGRCASRRLFPEFCANTVNISSLHMSPSSYLTSCNMGNSTDLFNVTTSSPGSLPRVPPQRAYMRVRVLHDSLLCRKCAQTSSH